LIKDNTEQSRAGNSLPAVARGRRLTLATKKWSFPSYMVSNSILDTLSVIREEYQQAVVDLFEDSNEDGVRPALEIAGHSSNFLDNMRLPIHRWFRYSAGFSAEWVKWELAERRGRSIEVLDPFLGSGTTCLACDEMGISSHGIEAHPFIRRIASIKLRYDADVSRFIELSDSAVSYTRRCKAESSEFPELIKKCYSPDTLDYLSRFKKAVSHLSDETIESELLWLSLVCSLRVVSEAGTAPWQYVLPGRRKTVPPHPETALRKMINLIAADVKFMSRIAKPLSSIHDDDARMCASIPKNSIDFVITSPPYANNYDYADATRLEMAFLGEISGWGDLQEKVRKHLVRACSQHVPPKSVNIDEVLSYEELKPIRSEIQKVCSELSEIRLTKGGKKTYNNMVACYFHDMARTWHALRKVCASPSEVCFVIGDSAPYGVYVPVIDWLGKLALSAGFKTWEFIKLRDRNTKWKNRKHTVPLCEGQLWVNG